MQNPNPKQQKKKQTNNPINLAYKRMTIFLYTSLAPIFFYNHPISPYKFNIFLYRIL